MLPLSLCLQLPNSHKSKPKANSQEQYNPQKLVTFLFLANLCQRVIFRNYLRKGVSFQSIYGGISFAMDVATCNCDTIDTAINSGKNGPDVAGCCQHQQRYSPCRQYQWRDMCQYGQSRHWLLRDQRGQPMPPIPMAGHVPTWTVPPVAPA